MSSDQWQIRRSLVLAIYLIASYSLATILVWVLCWPWGLLVMPLLVLSFYNQYRRYFSRQRCCQLLQLSANRWQSIDGYGKAMTITLIQGAMLRYLFIRLQFNAQGKKRVLYVFRYTMTPHAWRTLRYQLGLLNCNP